MKNNRFRCHPSIIVENLGTLIVGVLAVLVFNIDDFIELFQEASDAVDLKDTLIGLGILLLLVAVFTGYQFIIYLKTWISIENDTLLIERLTLLRNVRRSFNIRNISNINLEQNLFERVIGTCKVKIDTNSQSTANKTDIKIVLKLSHAKEFRNFILEQLDGKSREETQQFERTAEDYHVTYTPGQVAKHCLYSVSISVVVMMILIIVGTCAGIVYFSEDGFSLKSLGPMMGGLFTMLWITVTCLYSLVSDFFRYYGFRAKRVEDRILLSYGLLRKRQYVLPVDKINTVKVRAHLISRICRRQSVEVICIGVGDEKDENSLLLLSEKNDEISRRLALLLPEFAIEEPEMEKRKACSLFSELRPMVIVGVIEAVIVALIAGLAVPNLELPHIVTVVTVSLAILFFAIYLVSVLLELKTEGMHIGEDTLVVVTGAFTREVTWIPYRRIQSLSFSQGPFARHFGYASGQVSILATTTSSIHLVPPLDEKLYRIIQEKIIKL